MVHDVLWSQNRFSTAQRRDGKLQRNTSCRRRQNQQSRGQAYNQLVPTNGSVTADSLRFGTAVGQQQRLPVTDPILKLDR